MSHFGASNRITLGVLQVVPRFHAHEDSEDVVVVGCGAVLHPGTIQQTLPHCARHDTPLYAQPTADQGRRTHVLTQADMRAAFVIIP